MKNIKAILLGCGMVGSGIIKESYQKGVDYIGVFDILPDMIGKDVGDVIREPAMGIRVRHIDELEECIGEYDIDIAIHTVTFPFVNTLPAIRMLLSNKINVLTSLADIYAMQRHFPEIYKELDELAKVNGVTFFASGIQDVFWTALPVALTGCCLNIKEIKGTNIALIDYFGPSVADECYVGWDIDQFNSANESGKLPVNDFLIALYELAKKLNLHPISESGKMKPLLAKEDMYFEPISRHVEKGRLLGNSVESVIKTEEGVDLVCNFVSKMSEEGDTDLNKWEIIGVPNINVITEHMQGEITTSSNIINRIPDVINAVPGVVSACEMSAPFYKIRGLNEYVR
jgi:4-hydroxy-tetrahydrodipicolinate reductase